MNFFLLGTSIFILIFDFFFIMINSWQIFFIFYLKLFLYKINALFFLKFNINNFLETGKLSNNSLSNLLFFHKKKRGLFTLVLHVFRISIYRGGNRLMYWRRTRWLVFEVSGATRARGRGTTAVWIVISRGAWWCVWLCIRLSVST